MERPTYDEVIARQNQIYAMDIIERYRDKPKSPDSLLAAVTSGFILGAGGYEGSFDAAMVLEAGGLELLLTYLGIADLDTNPSAIVSSEVFEEAVHAAVDFGASYDELELEISSNALSDGEVTGTIFGPLAQRFNLLNDDPWLPE